MASEGPCEHERAVADGASRRFTLQRRPERRAAGPTCRSAGTAAEGCKPDASRRVEYLPTVSKSRHSHWLVGRMFRLADASEMWLVFWSVGPLIRGRIQPSADESGEARLADPWLPC